MTESTISRKNENNTKQTMIECFILGIIYYIGFLLSNNNPYISGGLLIITGIITYFYFSFSGTTSFLKFNALFSAVWLATIGLAQMRFMAYQTVWVSTTWLAVGLAHITFIVANNSAHNLFPGLDAKLSKLPQALKLGPLQIVKVKRSSNFYFWLATICSIIGIGSFIANVLTKGFIPLFVIAERPAAYFDFYTKYQIFYVASTVTAGLSYFAAIKSDLAITKKILLFSYLLILVFILPILLVQRGTFLNAALVLLAAVYMLSNREFWVLLVSLALIFGIYMIGSSIRGYSETQLDALFPTEIISTDFNEPGGNDITNQPGTTKPGSTKLAKTKPGSIKPGTTKPNSNSFVMNGKTAFLYSYLTVGHDNFNYAVINKTENTWGLRQLNPFNVILRSPTIKQALAKAENYLILPHLNAHNLIDLAYYDLGIPGVIIFMFFWSFIFGTIEAFFNKRKGVFSLMAYGVCLTPIILNFFEWMANFTTWLLLGTVFLLFVFSTFKLQKISGNGIPDSSKQNNNSQLLIGSENKCE